MHVISSQYHLDIRDVPPQALSEASWATTVLYVAGADLRVTNPAATSRPQDSVT